MAVTKITLLEKARLGRRLALTALTVARLDDFDDTAVSIFDDAFDVQFGHDDRSGSNVIAFPSGGTTPRPALLAA